MAIGRIPPHIATGHRLDRICKRWDVEQRTVAREGRAPEVDDDLVTDLEELRLLERDVITAWKAIGASDELADEHYGTGADEPTEDEVIEAWAELAAEHMVEAYDAIEHHIDELHELMGASSQLDLADLGVGMSIRTTHHTGVWRNGAHRVR